MATKAPFDFGDPKFTLEDLDWLASRKWRGNAKLHDLGFLGEAFAVNGMAEFPTIDEGTGKMVAGHGRVKKLVAMRAAGEKPPKRVVLRDGKWFVWTIRGMTFPEPGKHVVASNMGVQLGGWQSKLLLAAAKAFKGDYRGTGITHEDTLRLAALARGGWSSNIEAVSKAGSHMDAIPAQVVVTCKRSQLDEVRDVVTKAVRRSKLKGVHVA